MKRRLILLVICAAFCLGETCGGPSLIDAGRPGPQQGIPEGVYHGDRFHRTTLQATGVTLEPKESTTPYSVSFGPDGSLLGSDGWPVQAGDVRDVVIGFMVIHETVTRTVKGLGYYQVNALVEMEMELSPLGFVGCSGESVQTYTLEGDQVVYVGLAGVASGAHTWGSMLVTWEDSATLTR